MSKSTRPAMLAIVPAVLGFAILAGAAAADESAWQTDFQAAQTQARAEKKLLLVDFTGSDWCIWCKRLKAEVFDKDPFVAEVTKKFVLVELDFPNEKKLPDKLKEQNATLVSDLVDKRKQIDSLIGLGNRRMELVTHATGDVSDNP